MNEQDRRHEHHRYEETGHNHIASRFRAAMRALEYPIDFQDTSGQGMQLNNLFRLAAMEHENHLFTRLWRTLQQVEFWHELLQRLILLLALVVAAKLLLSVTKREVRTLARHRRGYRAATLVA